MRMAESAPSIEIQLLPADASDDAELMVRLTELTNEVYVVAEAGLWIDGATRTTLDEVVELTRAGQIAVARLSGRVCWLRPGAAARRRNGEFAMLVADPAHRGIGGGAPAGGDRRT